MSSQKIHVPILVLFQGISQEMLILFNVLKISTVFAVFESEKFKLVKYYTPNKTVQGGLSGQN